METQLVSSALSVLTLVLSVCSSGTTCMAQLIQWAFMYTYTSKKRTMLFGGRGMTKGICGTWLRWNSQQLELFRWLVSCHKLRWWPGFCVDMTNHYMTCSAKITNNFYIQIIFEGRRGSNDCSDVAIDDVKIYRGVCSGKKHERTKQKSSGKLISSITLLHSCISEWWCYSTTS